MGGVACGLEMTPAHVDLLTARNTTVRLAIVFTPDRELSSQKLELVACCPTDQCCFNATRCCFPMSARCGVVDGSGGVCRERRREMPLW